MKLIVRSFFLSLLLVFALGSIAGTLQQSGNKIAKGPSGTDLVPVSFKRPAEAADLKNGKPPGVDSSYRDKIEAKYKAAKKRLKHQAEEVEKYLKKNDFNAEYLFLVDMSIPSGKNRFFVYNLKKEEIETSSLVTHGIGSNRYENDDPLEFSNLPESKKTSEGKYKIGKSYYGKFGLAYKLHGLDKTNDKAYERDIVLHAHARVPDKECFPEYIIVSAGCPTVSPSFLTRLDKYIKTSIKPIMLWVYN